MHVSSSYVIFLLSFSVQSAKELYFPSKCLQSVVGWPQTAGKHPPTAVHSLLPGAEWGTEQKGQKQENLWIKVRRVFKRMKEEKTQLTQRRSLTLPHKQTNAQPVSEQWPFWKTTSAPLFFNCWVWCYMVWNTSSANSGQLCCLHTLSSSCPLPICLLGRREKKRKAWCCSIAAQQELAFVCYQKCFSHKSKTQHHLGWHEGSLCHSSQTQDIV